MLEDILSDAQVFFRPETIAIYGMDFRISKDKKEVRGINTF